MSNNKSSSNGIGFGGLLTLVFIVLKLCKVIDWSWWWILSPVWIGIFIIIIIFLAALFFMKK